MENDLTKRLGNKLEEIAEILINYSSSNKRIGVLGGSSGIALFHFYYAKFLDDDRYAEKGAQIISKVFDQIGDGYYYPTFCDGIAGAYWALELLKEEGFIELENSEIPLELDMFLLEEMNDDINDKKYDFLHGALGYGYYFLKRYQNTTSDIAKKRYKEYIYIFISYLKDSAIQSNSGIWWKSEINVGKKKFEVCNLGLSHGISSILNFLSRLAVYPDFYEETKPLIRSAAKHILSCRHTDFKLTSSFPNWITEEKSNGSNSRLAWCYGDLGVAISLLDAGKVLQDQVLINEAIQILRKSTKRREVSEARLKDAGVCHGAYGVMHIYHNIYRKTDDSLFKKTADHWAQEALKMAIHKDGYAGYLFGPEDSWEKKESLLNGIAGVGLVILSYLADFDIKWDEALMIGK